MSREPAFVIKKTRNLLGKIRYRVNLRGLNGENIMTSEQLESKEAVLNNIAAARTAAPIAEERWTG